MLAHVSPAMRPWHAARRNVATGKRISSLMAEIPVPMPPVGCIAWGKEASCAAPSYAEATAVRFAAYHGANLASCVKGVALIQQVSMVAETRKQKQAPLAIHWHGSSGFFVYNLPRFIYCLAFPKKRRNCESTCARRKSSLTNGTQRKKQARRKFSEQQLQGGMMLLRHPDLHRSVTSRSSRVISTCVHQKSLMC